MNPEFNKKSGMSSSKVYPILKIEDVRTYYAKMLVSIMSWIVKRFRQDGDYGWINTKMNLLTGEDFQDDDILHGKKTVYAWIQGRALEALAGHAVWMQQIPDTEKLTDSICDIIKCVYKKLDNARKQNYGHLYFMMDIDGKAFVPDETGKQRLFFKREISAYNYSDLFGSKGMYAAAKYLNDLDKIKEARKYCLDVIDSLWKRNFVSDQYSFRGNISGANDITYSLGPYMLCLNMVTNMLSEDEKFAGEGLKLLTYIIQNHVNSPPRWNFGKEYDCVENIDHDGMPLIKEGCALSDPGHCLEFTGFALKFLHDLSQLRFGNKYQSLISGLQILLVKILVRNFNNGFVSQNGGICKSYDLANRRIIDSHMPWWSLPEAMRAIRYALKIKDNKDSEHLLSKIFTNCHYCFSRNYVREDLDYLAIQTLGSDGKPAEIIPATPDADPGYHTGLSMIDCLSIY